MPYATQDPTPTPEARAQALRLAREARAQADARVCEATRAYHEADLVVREFEGDESPHTRWLRAHLAGDDAGAHKARVEMAAADFLEIGLAPSADIADEVTVEVARIRLEREH